MALLTGRRVLVLNAGSSSLKASVIDVGVDEPVAATSVAWGSDATRVSDRRATVTAALDELWQTGVEPASIAVAGHRVVHGGTRFREPTLMDDAALNELESLNELAPPRAPSYQR